MTADHPLLIEREVLNLINKAKIGTVCCCENNVPYCFNIFYSFLEREACLVFKSSEDTRHAQIMQRNNRVAGTVVPEKTGLANSSGIQFEGVILTDKELSMKASLSYYSRFPFAGVVKGSLWIVELRVIKYTSTVNGMRNKINWTRNQNAAV
jgi:uncharacterized protein YhbP (UPF0306 family)